MQPKMSTGIMSNGIEITAGEGITITYNHNHNFHTHSNPFGHNQQYTSASVIISLDKEALLRIAVENVGLQRKVEQLEARLEELERKTRSKYPSVGGPY